MKYEFKCKNLKHSLSFPDSVRGALEKLPEYVHMTLTDKQPIRSKNQNNYYFGVIVRILSDELGYTKNEMHDILKTMFLSEKKVLPQDGKVREVIIPKSTTTLKADACERYYMDIRVWAARDLGIVIPLPNEDTNDKER